jgi:hypothetical protein
VNSTPPNELPVYAFALHGYDAQPEGTAFTFSLIHHVPPPADIPGMFEMEIVFPLMETVGFPDCTELSVIGELADVKLAGAVMVAELIVELPFVSFVKVTCIVCGPDMDGGATSKWKIFAGAAKPGTAKAAKATAATNKAIALRIPFIV